MKAEEIARKLETIDDYGLFMFAWETIAECRDPQLIKACRGSVLRRMEEEGDFRTRAVHQSIQTTHALLHDVIEFSVSNIESVLSEMLSSAELDLEPPAPKLTVIEGGLSGSVEEK